jgi:GNAT superfamily N-acetyltransferase
MIATPAAEEVLYRPATQLDVAAMAQLAPEHLGNAPDWESRIAAYLSGEHHPRHALLTRVMIVAEQDDEVIGFIAGHLTRRFHCQGELQWINVSAALRRQGVATEMLRQLADWFVTYDACKICVDAKPRNPDTRAFYTHLGAEPINDHWLIWPDIRPILEH